MPDALWLLNPWIYVYVGWTNTRRHCFASLQAWSTKWLTCRRLLWSLNLSSAQALYKICRALCPLAGYRRVFVKIIIAECGCVNVPPCSGCENTLILLPLIEDQNIQRLKGSLPHIKKRTVQISANFWDTPPFQATNDKQTSHGWITK